MTAYTSVEKNIFWHPYINVWHTLLTKVQNCYLNYEVTPLNKCKNIQLSGITP
jgi:hypothetical protein